jgi:hypothetical protein
MKYLSLYEKLQVMFAIHSFVSEESTSGNIFDCTFFVFLLLGSRHTFGLHKRRHLSTCYTCFDKYLALKNSKLKYFPEDTNELRSAEELSLRLARVTGELDSERKFLNFKNR